MTGQHSGLRFDIYERVHLSEDDAGIRELDEMELVPHIQVYPDDDQAVLKGNLYLTGKYSGEQEGEIRTLEHLIPVEITLPMNRIHNLDEVAVDIENFDVDLLSSRSLNVTGILTLHGIEMISQAEESSWREEEEVVFIHEAERQPSLAEAAAENRVFEEDLTEEEAAEATDIADPQEAQEVFADYGVFDAVPAIDEAAHEALPAPEEKPELKIGFGSKPEQSSAKHLQSLLQKDKGESRSVQQPAAPAELEPETVRPDGLELKRLFVRTDTGGNQFSRMRMCIVQKEETLDGIAKRYNLNPREILLFNRIDGQEVGEGQVLYIPR